MLRNENYQPSKTRSIDEINKMLVTMAENKSDMAMLPGLQSVPSVDQKLLQSSLYVSFNPGGRLNKRHGSMESMGSNTNSVGSTGNGQWNVSTKSHEIMLSLILHNFLQLSCSMGCN